MRVIIDWRVMYSTTGGNYRCFIEILPKIASEHGISVGFLCRRRNQLAPDVGNSFPVRLPFPWKLLPESRLREWAWGRYLPASEDVVFHSLYYSSCPGSRLPLVVSVLDLITEKFPELSVGPGFDRLRALKREAIHRASRVIAISECTKKDLREYFNIDENRIDVVPYGVSFEYFSAIDRTGKSRGSAPCPLIDKPFILHVGGRANHKNFSRLAEAFSQSPLRKDFWLFSVGEPWTEGERELFARLEIQDCVRNFPSSSDGELRHLYQTCSAFVYPSLYEGFGLPPLEAMAAGAPTVVSNRGSIPEVVGQAGYYFDPLDLADIAKKMEEAVQAGRKAPRVTLGLERARRFSWENTAALTAQSYRKALGSSSP